MSDLGNSLLHSQYTLHVSDRKRASFKDPDLFRQMAVKLIADTPFDILSQIFDMEVLDPHSRETFEKLINPKITDEEQYELIGLRMEDKIRFKCKFNKNIIKLLG